MDVSATVDTPPVSLATLSPSTVQPAKSPMLGGETRGAPAAPGGAGGAGGYSAPQGEQTRSQLLGNIARLRWWTSRRAQATGIALSLIVWCAVAAAAELGLSDSEPGASTASGRCTMTPAMAAVAVWPAVVLFGGATGAALVLLRSISESAGLRAELIALLLTLPIAAALATSHVPVPTTAVVFLALVLAATLAWPLALSFSARYSRTNAQIDREKVKRLLNGAATLGSPEATDAHSTLLTGDSAATMPRPGGLLPGGSSRFRAALDAATPATVLAALLENADALAPLVAFGLDDAVALLALEARARADVARRQRELDVDRLTHPGSAPRSLPSYMRHGSMGLAHAMGAATAGADDGESSVTPSSVDPRPSPGAYSAHRAPRSLGASLRGSAAGFSGYRVHSGTASARGFGGPAGREESDGNAMGDLGNVEPPALPDDVRTLGFTQCLAHPATQAHFASFVESEMASENLLFLEAAHLFSLSAMAALLQAGLWHDPGHDLRPIRRKDRPAVLAMARSELGSRVAVHGGVDLLEWIGRAIATTDAWEELVRGRTKPAFSTDAAVRVEDIDEQEEDDDNADVSDPAAPEDDDAAAAADSAAPSSSTLVPPPFGSAAAAEPNDSTPSSILGSSARDSEVSQRKASDPRPARPRVPHGAALNPSLHSPLARIASLGAAGMEPAVLAVVASTSAELDGVPPPESGTLPAATSADIPPSGAAVAGLTTRSRSASPRDAGPSPDDLRRLVGNNVRDIVAQFIVVDAVMEINISSRSREACLRAARSSPMGDGLYTFVRPACHVRQTLRRDTYPRFLSRPSTTEWFARRPWEREDA